MEIEQLKVGFTCTNDGVLKGGAIGDWVYASSLPENYYKITGQKIIDNSFSSLLTYSKIVSDQA